MLDANVAPGPGINDIGIGERFGGFIELFRGGKTQGTDGWLDVRDTAVEDNIG